MPDSVPRPQRVNLLQGHNHNQINVMSHHTVYAVFTVDVTTAKSQGHLSNMNVIQGYKYVYKNKKKCRLLRQLQM